VIAELIDWDSMPTFPQWDFDGLVSDTADDGKTSDAVNEETSQN
jgi:hypothetical protein